jgi:hypothetical protein
MEIVMSGRDEIDRLIMKVMEESHLSFPVATYLVWMEIWSERMRRKTKNE